jgi:6-pyruvoyltetrahydropterin/6-carboxytetrahydropterin synthase
MIATVRLQMSIGHRLLGYSGKCAFLHGHNYDFEVSVNGKPDGLGLVVDFGILKKQLKAFLEPFDHALVLHEDDPVAEVLRQEKLVLLSVNPSAENFASLIFNHLLDIGYSPNRVVVRETEDGFAEANAVDRGVRVRAMQ